MLVTDRLRRIDFSDRAFEPCACILAARLPRQGEPPFPQMLFKIALTMPRDIGNGANSQGMKLLLGHFADTRDVSNVKRSEKLRLLSGYNVQNAVGLCFP